jgi:ribosomal peptide maturation radical SAM protein 1
VILVSMPWQAMNRTPIQTGILRAVLERAGFSAGTRSFYLDAAEYFVSATAHLPEGERLTGNDYQKLSYKVWEFGLSDWVFAVPPYHEWDAARDEEYFAYVRAAGLSEEALARALRIRRLVPSFLERCAEDIMSAGPRVVGFTSSFSQNVPSLVLSKMLKERDPSLFVVFGGANCDGEMGAALHRGFPWVDAVVRGEGERVLTEVVRDVLGGAPVRPQPRLCYRGEDGRSIAVSGEGAEPVPMDEVPPPDYGEYFARLERSPLRGPLSDQVIVNFESARGCWWGEKSHCTFCGLNGSSMKFRSKTAARVVSELKSMSARYKQVDFVAADNIIDMRYVQELLPPLREMRRAGYDLTLFYETKSNLKKEQLRAMRDAGVIHIQPGVESISNTILKLMRKGVTALQNIRLLKWAQQYGISVVWNILYGFPGEPPAEYERMAEVLPSLTHLPPPETHSILVERFSPYHQNPEAFGLKSLKPFPFYRHLYRVDEETLNDLAYDFTHEYADGRDPEAYARPVIEFAERWRAAYRAGGHPLSYRRGPGFMLIRDRRFALPHNDYQLGEAESAIYLACDAGATPAAVARALRERGHGSVSVGQVKAFLESLRRARLVYEEDGKYLSLAVATNAEEEDLPQAEESDEPAALVQIGRGAGVLIGA